MELIILSRDEKYLDTLMVDECITCFRDRKINSYNTLEFSVYIKHDCVINLMKNNRIIFRIDDEDRWCEYIISCITKENDIVTVQCESSLYSTLSNYVEFIDITGNTVINGLIKIFNNCTPESDWNVGQSDISGSFYMQRSKKQLKEVIYAWAEAVGGEIDERVEFYDCKIVRYVDIVKKMGSDEGKVLYDDREIRDCSIKIPEGYVYTQAYGYGASSGLDENGAAIFASFENVVWRKENGNPVDKPAGQKYVSLDLNDNQMELYGLRVDGKYRHRTTVVEFSDVVDGENLLTKTYQALINNISDKTEYTINSIDMKKLGYDVEEIRLGDTVGVVIEKLGNIKLKARVLRYKEDFKNSENNSFELNNYSNNYVSQQLNYQQAIKEINNKVQGVIQQNFLKTVLERWNDEINAEGSYLIQGNPLDGLIAYNAISKELATKATRLKGGSLQISNRKINGEFEWTTVLTGDGMIADVIVAGILKGNMFDIDLDSGVIQFGKRDNNGNITNPIFVLDQGQIVFGDANNYIKYHKEDGRYSLEVSASTIKFGGKGTSIEEEINNLKDEITTVIAIESSRGTQFKNSSIATTLIAVIYRGSQRITDITALREAMGDTASIRWNWKHFSDDEYIPISPDDPRIGSDGFTIALNPGDVDFGATFMCELIT